METAVLIAAVSIKVELSRTQEGSRVRVDLEFEAAATNGRCPAGGDYTTVAGG